MFGPHQFCFESHCCVFNVGQRLNVQTFQGFFLVLCSSILPKPFFFSTVVIQTPNALDSVLKLTFVVCLEQVQIYLIILSSYIAQR